MRRGKGANLRLPTHLRLPPLAALKNRRKSLPLHQFDGLSFLRLPTSVCAVAGAFVARDLDGFISHSFHRPISNRGNSDRDMIGSMSDVTRVLAAIERGDAHAAADLLPLVYDELRRLAAARLAHEAPGQTL